MRETKCVRSTLRRAALTGRIECIALAGLLIMTQVALAASASTSSDMPLEYLDLVQPYDFTEPWKAGWTLSVDNDAFAKNHVDRDYTGGIVVTMSGRRASDQLVSFDRALKWLDRRTGFASANGTSARHEQRHAIQFGVLLFTPDDIGESQPIEDDRPYANLVFIANSQSSLHPTRRKMYESTFAVGLLGTPIGEGLQKAIHKVAVGRRPQGFDNQIADGGEATFRYGVARHSLLLPRPGRNGRYDIKLMIEGSAGFLTEGSVALGLRWGKISTPWWSSTSEYADYAARPSFSPRSALGGTPYREAYLWTGVRLRARAYNAFLQGQLRHSAVTFSSSELQRLLMEAWIGFTTEFKGLRISYALRHQTKEIKSGPGSRGLTWAGITITQQF